MGEEPGRRRPDVDALGDERDRDGHDHHRLGDIGPDRKRDQHAGDACGDTVGDQVSSRASASSAGEHHRERPGDAQGGEEPGVEPAVGRAREERPVRTGSDDDRREPQRGDRSYGAARYRTDGAASQPPERCARSKSGEGPQPPPEPAGIGEGMDAGAQRRAGERRAGSDCGPRQRQRDLPSAAGRRVQRRDQ